MAIKPQDWSYISQTFDKPRTTEMHQLVQYIISSGYAERLFAFTSLDDLVIGIYNPLEFDNETLRVHFDKSLYKWQFVYSAKPFTKPTFTRQYDADKGLEKFAQFVKWIRW